MAPRAQPNRVDHVNFDDGTEDGSGRTLMGDLGGASGAAQAEAIHRVLLHLLLNHTVVPEVMKDDEGNEVGRRLSASSPDEEAFVFACQFFGYLFVTRSGNSLIVKINGLQLVFECVMILQYTQMRKRMGVVMREPDGRLFLCAARRAAERRYAFANSPGASVHSPIRPCAAPQVREGCRQLHLRAPAARARGLSRGRRARRDARAPRRVGQRRPAHARIRVRRRTRARIEECICRMARRTEHFALSAWWCDSRGPQVPVHLRGGVRGVPGPVQHRDEQHGGEVQVR